MSMQVCVDTQVEKENILAGRPVGAALVEVRKLGRLGDLPQLVHKRPDGPANPKFGRVVEVVPDSIERDALDLGHENGPLVVVGTFLPKDVKRKHIRHGNGRVALDKLQCGGFISRDAPSLLGNDPGANLCDAYTALVR